MLIAGLDKSKQIVEAAISRLIRIAFLLNKCSGSSLSGQSLSEQIVLLKKSTSRCLFLVCRINFIHFLISRNIAICLICDKIWQKRLWVVWDCPAISGSVKRPIRCARLFRRDNENDFATRRVESCVCIISLSPICLFITFCEVFQLNDSHASLQDSGSF